MNNIMRHWVEKQQFLKIIYTALWERVYIYKIVPPLRRYFCVQVQCITHRISLIILLKIAFMLWSYFNILSNNIFNFISRNGTRIDGKSRENYDKFNGEHWAPSIECIARGSQWRVECSKLIKKAFGRHFLEINSDTILSFPLTV
jgi:hypothetical protein